MSTWGERAHRAAGALDMEAVEATDPEDVQYGFREGAHWQRAALLSDETVERAARAVYENRVAIIEDPEERRSWPTWEGHESGDADSWRDAARVALTAAIGDDDE